MNEDSEIAYPDPADVVHDFSDSGENRSEPESIESVLNHIVKRVDSIEKTQEALRDGVNTIGEMMNSVAQAFDQIMAKVNSGGIAGLLGNFMGRTGND